MIRISTVDQINATENNKTNACRQHQVEEEEGGKRGQGIGVLPYVKGGLRIMNNINTMCAQQ